MPLEKNYSKMHKSLDSLGVWYVLHRDNDKHKSARGIVDTKKMYSISDGKGSVKVWAILLDNRVWFKSSRVGPRDGETWTYFVASLLTCNPNNSKFQFFEIA